MTYFHDLTLPELLALAAQIHPALVSAAIPIRASHIPLSGVMNQGCCEGISLPQRSFAIRVIHQWLGSLGVMCAIRFAFLPSGLKNRLAGLKGERSADGCSQWAGFPAPAGRRFALHAPR
jgi:hypothetical protein